MRLSETQKIKLIDFLVVLVKGIFVVGMVVSATISLRESVQAPIWREARTTHNIVQEDNSSSELLWRQEVFTTSLDNIQMVAVDGRVFFLGSIQPTEGSHLIALQGDTGKTLWKKDGHFLDIDVDTNAVYVGGASRIYALTLNAGEEIWSIKLPGFHNNVMYLYAVGDILYTAGSDSGQHLKDIKTGKIFDVSQPFRSLPPGILTYIPTITEDKIVFGAGKNAFGPCSVHQRQPYYKFLWKTEDKNVISNVAVSENVVYFLTYDDEIMMLDINTGKELGSIRIEPSINFFKNMGTSQNSQNDGYHIAVDNKYNLLYDSTATTSHQKA